MQFVPIFQPGPTTLSIGRTAREVMTVAAIALVCAAISLSPALEPIRGLSLDILTALRWKMFASAPDPAASPAVVVAIDEESYRAAPFKGSPTLTWTGEIGRVLGAIIDGGARVVGFDLVIPTSIELSQIPFGEGVLGEKVRGFDRDFLRALASASTSGKVVLGEILRGDQPILPSPGQRVAVRQQQNIRPLNVHADSDDTVRRIPLTFIVGDAKISGMALELASRAQGATPDIDASGNMTLAGYRIPSPVTNTMTLNFAGGSDDIPTFSFADLRACAAKGEKDYFRRWFDGKVVLIGTVLDIEDRQATSKRFATAGNGRRPLPRCAPDVSPPAAPSIARSTIAGVYIHATAVNNLITRNAAIELGRLPTFLIAFLFAALAATAARLFRPLAAVLSFAAVSALGLASATFAFTHALALPLVEPFTAGMAALAAMVGLRFAVTDRDRRLLQKSFALYLAPHVINRMLSSKKLPELGGETREVTVFFSDIAGFSAIAENMPPDRLMSLMNEYLSDMTDVIEAKGGYVDKYIGDSIVAVFGAPADDPDHAANATRAALDCCTRLAELNATSPVFREHPLTQRIGINSGEALVGNFGSRRRFNYSVMSDAVNLASRLEGANKFYGTTIIASDATVALAGSGFAWRELDEVRVKGRNQALKIYELVARSDELSEAQQGLIKAYGDGLAHWRAGKFHLATEAFSRSAATDKPAALFQERAEQMAAQPLDTGWEPIRTLQEK
ncbi:adenylate/guanylate cyclase domain-containing protein [Bradyrhizobium cenepequi]|uniref:adenylate/guanylate cyclase domain-containing protein n=1 Tax=Bradyrhizobium cenepequi TaxID=2821403 RepID=UPI001CE32BD0|nr:adenylate/guanylate cyclase domain-containing protein [Bradyrhizobium cenepequi]MCA6109745.1 adenylate/guanylate cyclase domain-containing protein [Bradyrhizobium cenepequi]